MPAAALLERLQKVRGKGPTWAACCPAHQDRSPSMAVKELPDGRVLVHCFAGCEVADILAAVGLDWSAIMPPDRLTDEAQRPQYGWTAEVVSLMAFELRTALLILGDLEHQRRVLDSDRKRAKQAADKLAKWLAALEGSEREQRRGFRKPR